MIKELIKKDMALKERQENCNHKNTDRKENIGHYKIREQCNECGKMLEVKFKGPEVIKKEKIKKLKNKIRRQKIGSPKRDILREEIRYLLYGK